VKIGVDYCSVHESIDFIMPLSIDCVKVLELIWFHPITIGNSFTIFAHYWMISISFYDYNESMIVMIAIESYRLTVWHSTTKDYGRVCEYCYAYFVLIIIITVWYLIKTMWILCTAVTNWLWLFSIITISILDTMRFTCNCIWIWNNVVIIWPDLMAIQKQSILVLFWLHPFDLIWFE